MQTRSLITTFALAGILLLGGVPASAGLPPENGVVRTRYDNGRVQLERVYKRSHLVRERRFYRNGRLAREVRYRDDQPYLIRYFYESGKLKSIWTQKTGITKYYRLDGTMRTIRGPGKVQDIPVVQKSSYIFSE